VSQKISLSLVLVVLFAASLVHPGSAQAQSLTPGSIVKWFDDKGDLTDSVIFEDEKTGNVGIGTTTPNARS